MRVSERGGEPRDGNGHFAEPVRLAFPVQSGSLTLALSATVLSFLTHDAF